MTDPSGNIVPFLSVSLKSCLHKISFDGCSYQYVTYMAAIGLPFPSFHATIITTQCESKWSIGLVLQPKHNTKKTKREYWFACAELDRSCTERGTTPRGLMQQKSRGSSGLQRQRRTTGIGPGLCLSLGQRLALE